MGLCAVPMGQGKPTCVRMMMMMIPNSETSSCLPLPHPSSPPALAPTRLAPNPFNPHTSSINIAPFAVAPNNGAATPKRRTAPAALAFRSKKQQNPSLHHFPRSRSMISPISKRSNVPKPSTLKTSAKQEDFHDKTKKATEAQRAFSPLPLQATPLELPHSMRNLRFRG